MILNINGLTYSYEDSERKVLNSVDLQIKEGDVMCILGPNGAGKTTLLNCMAGLLEYSEGNIEICERPQKEMSAKEIAGVIAYVPQTHTPSFDYSVMEFVLMGRAHNTSIFGRPGAEDEECCMNILRSMEIEHLADRSYINISGGERQQVLIARALAQEPEIVLFDEPTSHLDYGNQQRVLKKIMELSRAGIAAVITTHDPDHALLLGDKVAILDGDGHMTSGETDLITEERLRDIYNTDLRIMYVEELGRKVCLVPGIK